MRLFQFLAILLCWQPAALLAQAGPPFQTDDPTPVDLHHYEAYIFGVADGTPAEMDTISPGFEFNWGAIPNIQLHAILPIGAALPTNKEVYAPGGTGPSSFGLEDIELGVKYGFIRQTKYRPQIGSFTMLEIPTGSYSEGLGVGHVWYKLPLWVEKEFAPWSLVGGMGYGVVPQTGYRNYLYGGFLAKRELSKKLELSAEIFSHAREGFATPQTQASTLLDAGGYYPFNSPGLQLLFAYGTPSPGRPRTMPTWACTRRGVKTMTMAGKMTPGQQSPAAAQAVRSERRPSGERGCALNGKARLIAW